MTKKVSPYLCGFRKIHNSQYLHLKIIETWEKRLDKGEKVEVILVDLSKAFGKIRYSLLLAKLNASRVSRTSFRAFVLMHHLYHLY